MKSNLVCNLTYKVERNDLIKTRAEIRHCLSFADDQVITAQVKNGAACMTRKLFGRVQNVATRDKFGIKRTIAGCFTNTGQNTRECSSF
jgi:hypothetical protein